MGKSLPIPVSVCPSTAARGLPDGARLSAFREPGRPHQSLDSNPASASGVSWPAWRHVECVYIPELRSAWSQGAGRLAMCLSTRPTRHPQSPWASQWQEGEGTADEKLQILRLDQFRDPLWPHSTHKVRGLTVGRVQCPLQLSSCSGPAPLMVLGGRDCHGHCADRLTATRSPARGSRGLLRNLAQRWPACGGFPTLLWAECTCPRACHSTRWGQSVPCP